MKKKSGGLWVEKKVRDNAPIDIVNNMHSTFVQDEVVRDRVWFGGDGPVQVRQRWDDREPGEGL
ncbi:hypothetical protein LTR78_006285 [Recurvomyces mirabilis]|uniref:Uncharacterized protein n=1 Tax=Recurvomyces mirabilis TaxID=574656 RepID=A0AAE1C062_9PEZI|nr:hypothetical protein LTR78_006285 [Recurvomyces mirabilis]KAK5152174.1 hypothetical protein LTS14_008549 [Recurvomyces mirabilis]